jgi:hypothetical protein
MNRIASYSPPLRGSVQFSAQVPKTQKALPPAFPPDQKLLPPGKTISPGAVKQLLGTAISLISLGLGLVATGLIRLPKVPLFSLPAFGLVFGAFAANEALNWVADKANIPTVHHKDTLRGLLETPGKVFSKQFLDKTWAIFYGGKNQKAKTVEDFLGKNREMADNICQALLSNPIFEDLSDELRAETTLKGKAKQLGRAGVKLLGVLIATSLLPGPLRLTVGPWLAQWVGVKLKDPKQKG